MAVPPLQLTEWLFSGFTEIERFTPEGTVMTRVPFAIRSRTHPGVDELDRRARQVAVDFLTLLSDTAPAHRDDYGKIQGSTFQFVGVVPVGTTPAPETLDQ